MYYKHNKILKRHWLMIMKNISNFDDYHNKIRVEIRKIDNLRELVIWRKRSKIRNYGLSYKVKESSLVLHQYNK